MNGGDLLVLPPFAQSRPTSPSGCALLSPRDILRKKLFIDDDDLCCHLDIFLGKKLLIDDDDDDDDDDHQVRP